MPHPTRTLGPLHFEDLEPHRFEDLVRQLAYGFRTWHSLEATGRLGADEGMDIRGMALLRADPDVLDEPTGDEGEDAGNPVLQEQEWRIQCKRYQKIGASLMRAIVRETVPDPLMPPYGLVVAAACDVSAQTMTAFRDEARKHHVREAHLWTKAQLEDMLFRPAWDHLLFAYFGISLGTRRQSQLQQVRARVALKRKLVRVLEWDSMEGGPSKPVLIRDVLDDAYPDLQSIPGFTTMETPPWHMARLTLLHTDGMWVARKVADGWVKSDGTWDIFEPTLQDLSYLGSDHDYWNDLRADLIDYDERRRVVDQVPDRERRTIELWRALPYDNVLEVDPLGDPVYAGPHLYCRFLRPDRGPYTAAFHWVALDPYPMRGASPLALEKRARLYPDLIAATTMAPGEADDQA